MRPNTSESRVRRTLTVGREYLTHSAIAGAIIALTGFAPEHWIADLFGHLAFSETLRAGWLRYAFDVRIGLVAIGVAVVAWDVVRRSNLQKRIALHDNRAETPPLEQAANRSSGVRQATDASGLALPDKPSIAVLAFHNMSGDPEQEYFADGIASDIITALSKSRWLFVIARNSSFTYKGHAVDIKQIGRELGVRYVLEGSVRKAGNRVRITGQFVEAATGTHLWAERYDRALEDIFAVQDEITQSIICAIAPGILAAEIQRSQGKEVAELGQWERLMRAHWHIRRFTREDSNKAIRLLDELLRRQPDNALALADLAFSLHFAALFGWTDSPAAARARMSEMAHRAVASDEQDAAAHTSLSIHELFSGQHDKAIQRLLRAIDLDPNSAFARGYLGTAYAFGGECDPAIQNLREAMRLSPRDFLMVVWFTVSAWAYLSAGKFEQAAECGKRAIDCNPAFPDAHATFAAASAHLGHMADARDGLDGFMRLMPGLTAGDERLIRPFRRPADRERFLEGLRKAGLPEK